MLGVAATTHFIRIVITTQCSKKLNAMITTNLSCFNQMATNFSLFRSWSLCIL